METRNEGIAGFASRRIAAGDHRSGDPAHPAASAQADHRERRKFAATICSVRPDNVDEPRREPHLDFNTKQGRTVKHLNDRAGARS